MLQHHVRLQNKTICMSVDKLNNAFMKQQTARLHKIQTYVLVTAILFAILFPLGGSKKRFNKILLNLVSSACYTLVPVLCSYTLGLMGEPDDLFGGDSQFPKLYGIWAVFLLFAYGSFDNLSAYNLGERNGRSKILVQFLSQFVFLLLFAYKFPFKTGLLPILLVFLVVCLKVAERIVALAHAIGATPGVRKNSRRIINYMNTEADDEAEADPVSMRGFRYLVGPRYSKTLEDKIVNGVSIEEIWGCNGRLLSSESGGGDQDGKLKDTCLSFALFWLLLGKFLGYPLYKGGSRNKAWRLVHDGLLSGGSERAFRVIEVELCFLHDYFYSKYIFFYLNGFFWKLCLLGFPVMFWWFTLESIDYKAINSFRVNIYGVDPHVNPKPTAVVILVIFLLEVIQFGQLIASRWYKVTLLSHYAKRVMSKKTTTCLDWFYEKILAAICRISLCSGATLSKPWKRELDQYSLLELRKGFTVDIKFLQLLGDVFGIPLPKSGKKQGPSVALSPQVKSAVALSLRTNGPKLSKGLASLRRNGLEEELSWACKLETDIETILVWHIATSMCEMSPKSQELNTQSVENSKVATSLSKYCAYLLAFSPSLLPVCLLEAEELCDVAIKEARDMFEKRVSPCGKVEEVHKYEKLMDLVSDKEAGGRRSTAVQRGAKLGADLLSTVRDDGRRWKLLAEFWAEMILYLAPSNSNEMAHAEKLAEGGEFITHLWALLIHAGIVARET